MYKRQPYDTEWPIYARTPIRPPHFMGMDAKVDHSMVTSGCEVYGTVENSVLFHSVTVEEGAVVRYSILMPGTVVKKGAVAVSYTHLLPEPEEPMMAMACPCSREKLISSRTRVLPNRFWISSTCKIAMLCAPLKPGNSPASSRCGSGPGSQCR